LVKARIISNYSSNSSSGGGGGSGVFKERFEEGRPLPHLAVNSNSSSSRSSSSSSSKVVEGVLWCVLHGEVFTDHLFTELVMMI